MFESDRVTDLVAHRVEEQALADRSTPIDADEDVAADIAFFDRGAGILIRRIVGKRKSARSRTAERKIVFRKTDVALTVGHFEKSNSRR